MGQKFILVQLQGTLRLVEKSLSVALCAWMWERADDASFYA